MAAGARLPEIRFEELVGLIPPLSYSLPRGDGYAIGMCKPDCRAAWTIGSIAPYKRLNVLASSRHVKTKGDDIPAAAAAWSGSHRRQVLLSHLIASGFLPIPHQLVVIAQRAPTKEKSFTPSLKV
jgi:hypothetical protein